MSKKIKLFVYRLAYILGFFRLTRFFYRNHLRILCYHGFEINDEASFRPPLFIKQETFRKRMALLAQHGFHVNSLTDCLSDLYKQSLRPDTIAITIDDGYYGIFKVADPIFQRFMFPYTIYLTTYYVVKESPVFRLVIQYIAWKSSHKNISYDSLIAFGVEPVANRIRKNYSLDEVAEILIEYGEANLEESQRIHLCRLFADHVGVSYQDIVDSRILSLLTVDEAKSLSNGYADIELHTHRHVLPIDSDGIRKEITDNRFVLSTISRSETRHFCYPSGIWFPSQGPVLSSLGVESATTCMPGLNTDSTPPLQLNRFLDGENISEIEFLAELYGFSELMRTARNYLSRAKKNNGHNN